MSRRNWQEHGACSNRHFGLAIRGLGHIQGPLAEIVGPELATSGDVLHRIWRERRRFRSFLELRYGGSLCYL